METSTRIRPRAVTVAAVIQLLLVVTFLLSTFYGQTAGGPAQAAAEAELARQGVSGDVLAAHGVQFEEGVFELVLPLGVVAVLGTLALLNLAGKPVGRIFSWIFHSLLAVGGTLLVYGQVFTAQLIEAVFRNSADPAVRNVDVRAVVAAAKTAFPVWFPYQSIAKLVLVSAGSLLVIVLLATRPSNAWFRRVRTSTTVPR